MITGGATPAPATKWRVLRCRANSLNSLNSSRKTDATSTIAMTITPKSFRAATIRAMNGAVGSSAVSASLSGACCTCFTTVAGFVAAPAGCDTGFDEVPREAVGADRDADCPVVGDAVELPVVLVLPLLAGGGVEVLVVVVGGGATGQTIGWS